MSSPNLFRTRAGAWVTRDLLLESIQKTGAGDAEVLYIHSGLNLGIPNPELGRSAILENIFQAIVSLGVPTICMPTFTFSFCNGVPFNVQTSASRMGALNEFVRKLPGAHRSTDPLMSNVLIGRDTDLVSKLGKDSIGRGSTFDKLHQKGRGVRFLFIGTTVRECFTYTHYVEECLQVPYRYNREFTGQITDGDRAWTDTYRLFVRYQGVVPDSTGYLQNELIRSGALRVQPCGDSEVSCVDEPESYALIEKHLAENIDCYLDAHPHDRNKGFAAKNMVAL
jgi:aminoglycoside 3-N-acetyltransferase